MEKLLEGGQALFSVLVAAFLLLRMERRLAALTDAINALRHCSACRLSPLAGGEEGKAP